MAPPFFFGVYHWRRHLNRLGRSGLFLAVAAVLWRRGRLGRFLAVVLGSIAVRQAVPVVERFFSLPPWAIEQYKYDALADRLPTGDADRLLDVGCGTGRSLVGSAPTLGPTCSVVGLDVFDDRVILGNGPGLARRNAALAGLDVAIVAGDASRLPVATGTQDIVTACRVLHDLPRDGAQQSLDEMRRVCRPDARIGILELSRTHGVDRDPLDYWRELIMDAGFTVNHAAQVQLDAEPTGYYVLIAEPVTETGV